MIRGKNSHTHRGWKAVSFDTVSGFTRWREEIGPSVISGLQK